MSINVCSDNTWNGAHGTGVTLIAPASASVTLTADGPWPFQPPNNPGLLIPHGGVNVTLVSAPGTYRYVTAGCPDDCSDRVATNPKTVIIT
jgi:hypothetical protein